MRLKSCMKWTVVLLILGLTGLLLAGCGSAQSVESWLLNDGGTGTVVASELEKGTPGVNKWGVWLNNNTFGKVLDFSTQGSNVYVEKSLVEAGGDLSISAWIMAPVREEGDRVILMQGAPVASRVALDGFKLYLDGKNNHALAFEASGLTGTEHSGVSLVDGKWHHVLVTLSGNTLTYYIDGESVKTVSVSGKITATSSDLFIGSDTAGENGFDGSMAEVRIFNKAVTPADATSTVLNPKDNEPQQPRMDLQKGISIDRRQYYSPTPDPSEGQTVTEADIINCKNMGFDHVKLLLTPNHLMEDDGSLIVENMEYITQVIQYVVDNDYRCILCIHPEGDFKMIYLKNLSNFEDLLVWYGELAKYIGEHWDADTVALQLMTEPANNNMTVSWSWMSDRMWGAVRNVLPDHTILTSSDRWGNIEQLKYMSPASDSNLIYTFTTYEPYTIGWYYYGTTYGRMDAWSYVHDIPYPVEEGVDYTEAIEYAISDVPDSLKEGIRQELWAYVRGEYDGRRTDMPNSYESLYNREWHMMRAKSLDDWRQKYGGNIHIACVEFGCMDAQTPAKLWASAAPGYGITDEKRIEFTKDVIDSFEAYDIDWTYWSYNEAHTIFMPDAHSYGASPDPEIAKNMFDYEMLKDVMGLTPLVEPDGTLEPEVFDPSWLVINSFESAGNWSGTGLQVSYNDPPTGFGCVMSESQEAGGATVFFASYGSPMDASAYANGYAHLWIYVEDVSKLIGGQIELCSGGGPDMYETSWNLMAYVTQSGWTELYLPIAKAGQGNKPADLSAINYCRIFFLQSGEGKVGVDSFYLCNEAPEGGGSLKPAESADSFVISAVEELSPWFGTGHEMRFDGAPAGSGWIASTTRDGAGSAVFAAAFGNMNLTAFADGNIHLWVYVEDISKVVGGQFEFTSSGGPDNMEMSWDISKYLTQSGWNEVILPLSESNAVGGGADLTMLNYIRMYLSLTGDMVVGMDEVSIVK